MQGYNETLEQLQAERDRLAVENLSLRKFAKKMFDLAGWPDGGDIDGFEFQDAGVECGLLIPEVRTELCGEGCHCALYYGDDEWEEGIMCYRVVEWLEAVE